MTDACPCLRGVHPKLLQSASKAAAICTVLGHTVQVQDVITLIDEHVRMSATLGFMSVAATQPN